MGARGPFQYGRPKYKKNCSPLPRSTPFCHVSGIAANTDANPKLTSRQGVLNGKTKALRKNYEVN